MIRPASVGSFCPVAINILREFSVMFVVFEPNGTDFLVNSEVAGSQYDPKSIGLSNGNFVISWIDFSGTLEDISLSSVKARIFDSAGTPVGGEFLVNTNTDSYQWLQTITALSNGGFVISWTDLSGTLDDLTGSSIKAQIYDAAGSRVGSEFIVNSEIAGDQSAPTITGLTGGGFVVSWQDASATLGDASGTSIKAQIYSAAGSRVGSEFLVNTTVTGNTSTPNDCATAASAFFVFCRCDFTSLALAAQCNRMLATDTIFMSISTSITQRPYQALC